MKTKITTIVASAEIVMGIVHCIATFTPLIKTGLEILPLGKQHAITYFSLMCGILLVFCGSLVLLLHNRLRAHCFVRTPYKLAVGALFLDGLLSVVFMPANPFAWVIFALGLVLVIVSCRNYSE